MLFSRHNIEFKKCDYTAALGWEPSYHCSPIIIWGGGGFSEYYEVKFEVNES